MHIYLLLPPAPVTKNKFPAIKNKFLGRAAFRRLESNPVSLDTTAQKLSCLFS